MNNVQLSGQALRIVRSSADPKATLFDEAANLLVKNIDKEVTQSGLYDIFKVHGDIVSCKLETFPDGKTSRGLAYIQYKVKESAEEAVKALHGCELNGKKLEVVKHEKKDKSKAAEPSAPVLKNNLFVKNLPENTDDAKLKGMFEQFGAIESVIVQRDE
jgi:polyadenylate-binding protein